MDNLKVQQLQKLSKDISLLFVQSNNNLQNQVTLFLKKMFKNLYQTNSAKDSIEIYKNSQPDIIFIDMPLLGNNIIEMIVDIKMINQNAKIITISDRNNEDLNLLKSIDMGINSFLFKPLQIDILIESLIETLQKDARIHQKKCFDDLNVILKKKNEIEIFNSYKGISLSNSAILKNITDDEIIIQTPFVQSIAIRFEKQAILKLNQNNHIFTYFLKYDSKNNNIHLSNPRHINYKTRDLEHKRIIPDKNFQAILHYNHRQNEVEALEICFISGSFYIKNKQEVPKLNDNIELGMIFGIENKNYMMNETKTTKAFAKGKVIRLEGYKTGTKIVVSFEIKKSDLNVFNKYLQQREMNIVQEFKHLVQKYQ